MSSRQLLRVAVFCGAIGIVGGPAAHAQTPSSTRFVQLLLLNESKLIQKDTKALNTRDAAIVKLNSASSQRQINKLNKLLTRLNNQALALTLQLTVLSTQSLNYARQLVPPNSSLVGQALGTVATVQMLSARAGLIPATPFR